jgi:hypothetical protein
MSELEAGLTVPRQSVLDAIVVEDQYAHGWGLGGTRKPSPYTSVRTQRAFSEMEWIVFAEKYLSEAKLGYANYVKDVRSIHIRILKAASLLVNALATHSTEEQLKDIAGVSSSKYPIFTQGLKDLKDDPEPTKGDQA